MTNFMDQMQARAATQSQSTASTFGMAPPVHASDVMQAITNVTNQPQRAMGLADRWAARAHASKEILATHKLTITSGENAVRNLVNESILAETELLREKMKLVFDSKFGVLAEKSLASLAEIQDSLYAVVDAYTDRAHEYLHDRLRALNSRHCTGKLSQQHFQEEINRAWAQTKRKVDDLEADCQKKLETVKQTFASRKTGK